MRIFVVTVALVLLSCPSCVFAQTPTSNVHEFFEIDDGYRIRCAPGADLRIDVRGRASVDVTCNLEATPIPEPTATMTPTVALTPTATSPLPTVTPTPTTVPITGTPSLAWEVQDWNTANVILHNVPGGEVRDISFRLYPDPALPDSLPDLACTTVTPDGRLIYPTGWDIGVVYNYEHGFYGVRLAIQPHHADNGIPIRGRNVWILQCFASDAGNVVLETVEIL